jgi:hypothetical protein
VFCCLIRILASRTANYLEEFSNKRFSEESRWKTYFSTVPILLKEKQFSLVFEVKLRGDFEEIKNYAE